MDRFEQMRVFTRIVESGGLNEAAHSLGMSVPAILQSVAGTEERLGITLLEEHGDGSCTTLDGQLWYRKCRRILDELDQAESTIANRRPGTRLRVNVLGALARYYLLPRLADFFLACPEVDLQLTDRVRLGDLAEARSDCVLGLDLPENASETAYRLGILPQVTAAAPGYLAHRGTPRTPNELRGHRCIAVLSAESGTVAPFRFMLDGKAQAHPLDTTFVADSIDTRLVAARLGHGLIQAPQFQLQADLEAGRLIGVLPRNPPPDTIVSVHSAGQGRTTPALQPFIDWLRSIDFNGLVYGMMSPTNTHAGE